jgi:cysteinyl-tRNA synthetase
VTENEDAPVSKIITDFESNMNNDLNVKSVFDRLYEKVSELHKKRKSLRADDITNALSDLHKIDNILQCIFLD